MKLVYESASYDGFMAAHWYTPGGRISSEKHYYIFEFTRVILRVLKWDYYMSVFDDALDIHIPERFI